MRFPQAWANIASQNSVLRVAIVGVTASGLVALLISLKFAFKDPLIIERSCYSSIKSSTTSQEPTKIEYEQFIKEALSQRFDGDNLAQSDYLSIEELANKTTEQNEMKKRTVRQKIIVNSITRKDDSFFADTDRILAMGNLRSALPFPLTLKIQRTSRSEANPYGLILFNVSIQNQEGVKNESK